MEYDFAFAQILDYSRKFLLASTKYYSIVLNKDLKDESVVPTLLTNACKCAILGTAGP